jgi:uncharacterized membrane protein (DUF106 family)
VLVLEQVLEQVLVLAVLVLAVLVLVQKTVLDQVGQLAQQEQVQELQQVLVQA